MSYTASATRTTTMTEARVRAVMQKVNANFTAFVIMGLVTKERADDWTVDLTFLQVEEALAFFEIQLRTPAGECLGLRYTVSMDGSLQQDSASGGLDLYCLPAGTRASLYAHLRNDIPASVRETLKKRGWGFDGQKLNAPESEQRAFSDSGYGLIRAKLGTWP